MTQIELPDLTRDMINGVPDCRIATIPFHFIADAPQQHCRMAFVLSNDLQTLLKLPRDRRFVLVIKPVTRVTEPQSDANRQFMPVSVGKDPIEPIRSPGTDRTTSSDSRLGEMRFMKVFFGLRIKVDSRHSRREKT